MIDVKDGPTQDASSCYVAAVTRWCALTFPTVICRLGAALAAPFLASSKRGRCRHRIAAPLAVPLHR